MRFKKIRGHKRRWKQIEAWRLDNISLLLNDYLLNTRDRHYTKIQIHPWNSINLGNSAIPAPRGKTKQLMINALIDIYNDWKAQLDTLGMPYYLKIWLYEPNFVRSQVVCAIRDNLHFYDAAFLEGDEDKTLDTKQYGIIAPKMEKLQWEHYIEEEHYENDFVGIPEIYATLEDYNDTLRWFNQIMKKPHRTTPLDKPTEESFEFYSFKKGYIWLGREQHLNIIKNTLRFLTQGVGHCEARSNLFYNLILIILKPGFTYIITNYTNTTLYIGVTSNLHDRIKQHKNKIYPNSFSAKYNLNKLVYFEQFQMIEDAIGREKQLKGGSRLAKVQLIEGLNPDWNDLFFDLENYM